jgi:hypothetical protein
MSLIVVPSELIPSSICRVTLSKMDYVVRTIQVV